MKIYTINIVHKNISISQTRYKDFVVNRMPIIVIEQCSIEDLIKDEDFDTIIEDHIKGYNKEDITLFVRCIDLDDEDPVQEMRIPLTNIK